MAGFNYGKAALTALRLIKRFGQSVIIRRTTTTGGNEWDPTSGTTQDVDYAAQAVVTDYKEGLIDGEAVKYGDKRIILAAKGLSITPETTDKLIVGDVNFTIVRVTTVSPAGTIVVYELQARL